MTRVSAIAKGAALSCAVLAHGALALVLVTPEPVQIEGAQGAAEVRLGSGFQDMAAGTLAPERADAALTPVPAESTPAKTPEKAEAQRSPEAMAPEAATPSATASSDLLAPRQPDVSAPAVRSLSSTSVPERLASTPPETASVTQSARPKLRSAAFVAKHKAPPPPKVEARSTVKKSQPKGNARQNTRAGEASGKATAKARASGNGGQKQAAGNAAASNYPGEVMRRLSRAGKPRVNARGTAVIAFSIAASGGIASVSLARSSGSATLDQAAVRLVRGAGPFPKPPQGAMRRFSIEIKGR